MTRSPPSSDPRTRQRAALRSLNPFGTLSPKLRWTLMGAAAVERFAAAIAMCF